MRPLRWFGLGAALLASSALTQDNIPIRDLGVKQAGEQHPLTLAARNLNCETPQDFEFLLDNMPWLTADGPLIVRNLGPGQSRSIKATLDFKYTPPGVHYGRVTSRCITCGWYVFAGCSENAQDVVLKVTVNDPSVAGQQNFPDNNPYAGMTPRQPVAVRLAQPVSDENIRVLKSGDRKDLNKARGGLKQAEARGQAAQNAVSAAQKKKSDCERKLAQLKAEAAAAQRKADIAEQDAKNAAGAAKAAEKALDDFEKDEKAALKKIDATGRAVIVAKKYLDQVTEADGPDSGRVKRAQEQLDRFQQEHFDALREHSAVVKSKEAREAAAAKTKADAAAAEAAAKAAKAAAKAAQDKVKAQAKICKKDADDLVAAQKALTGARAAAADAVKAANKAEAKAAGQAYERLKDRIKKQKEKCQDMEKRAKEEIAKWKEAIEAGQQLKMLDDDGGRAASALKEINDKIWDAARDQAQDSTIATTDSQGNLGFTNDDSAALASADTAEDMLDRVTTLMGWAVDGLSSVVGGKGVPDFGQSQMLGGMKALGLGMQNIVNAIRNPNTYAAQRDKWAAILNKDESYPEQEMKSKGIGKNKAEREEIYKKIEQLYNNRNLIENITRRNANEAAKCYAEIKKMEARLAELKTQGGK